ncbi:hypothetical protein AMTRI_Chr09g16770 [Amborella trichopoda]
MNCFCFNILRHWYKSVSIVSLSALSSQGHTIATCKCTNARHIFVGFVTFILSELFVVCHFASILWSPVFTPFFTSFCLLMSPTPLSLFKGCGLYRA